MRHYLFGIPVDDVPLQDIKERIHRWLQSNHAHIIVTPNPEFVLLARSIPEFRLFLQQADLSVADGVGLRFAIAALTDGYLIHRHPGVDLVQVLCEAASMTSSRVLLLGGDPHSAEQAAERLKQSFDSLDLIALDPGMLTGDATYIQIPDSLIHTIQQIKPDVLIIALGQGKQEQGIRSLLPLIPSIKIAIGVGGSFENFSGQKPRAPIFFQEKGLEWIWRLWIEPSRFHRIFRACVIFPFMVISATLQQHFFLKALKKTVPEIWKQLSKKS